MSGKLYILNFELGLWLHSATESKLALQAAHDGWDVTTINCDGFLKGFCSVRGSRRRDVKQVSRGVDCKDCRFTNNLTAPLKSSRGVENLQIGRFLTDESESRVSSLLMEAQQYSDPLEFRFNGIPFGRIASHETILRSKITSSEIPEEARQDFFLQLEDCLRVYFAFGRLLSNVPTVSSFLIRNINYSTHRIIAQLAHNEGHKVFDLNESYNLTSSYTKVTISPFGGQISPRSYGKILFSNKISHEAFPNQVGLVRRHMKHVMFGNGWRVYSENANSKTDDQIRQSLKLSHGKKVILICLSSTDEVTAINTSYASSAYPGTVFPSQLEMVKETITWVKSKPDTAVVIRPHPRELPSRRHGSTSQMVEVWRELSKDLPANVVIDFPELENSLYDVMRICNTVVTGWSSAGLEASILGKPVVLYDTELGGYPPGVALHGNSKKDYLENLNRALKMTSDEQKKLKNVALNYLTFNELALTEVPSRFLSKQFAEGSQLLKKLINAVDRFFPLVRVMDLALYKRDSDLGPIYDVLEGKRISSFEKLKVFKT